MDDVKDLLIYNDIFPSIVVEECQPDENFTAIYYEVIADYGFRLHKMATCISWQDAEAIKLALVEVLK